MRDEGKSDSERAEPSVSRRHFVGASVASALAAKHGQLDGFGSSHAMAADNAAKAGNAARPGGAMSSIQVPAFALEEATITDLQTRMHDGRESAASLVK